MQKHLHEKNLDTLDLVEKRLEIIVGAKLIDKTKTEEAVLIQNKLRKKSKNWNGTEEIRKWREAR